MMKVIGIGWAKTGTTSLGDCCRILGYNHQTQDLGLVETWQEGDLSAIKEVANRFDSFEDWPWLLLYKEFDAWYPGSKFILTERDPEPWLVSYRKQLSRRTQDASTNRIRSFLYGLDFPDVTDEQLIERYQQHNRDVKAYFASRPDDFLAVDWSKGAGWKELCAFLGKPTPDCDFPRSNTAPSKAASSSRN